MPAVPDCSVRPYPLRGLDLKASNQVRIATSTAQAEAAHVEDCAKDLIFVRDRAKSDFQFTYDVSNLSKQFAYRFLEAVKTSA